MADPSLFLHEEVLLLALHDVKGTIAGPMYQYALGGAILAELLLNKRIEPEPTKKKLINVLDPTPLGDPITDECLNKIAGARRRAIPSAWVSRFASIKKLKDRVAQGLVRRGILRQDHDKVLFFFDRTIYPEADHAPEALLIERLGAAIFTDSADVDGRTVVLLSLARSADLLRVVFDKRQLRQRKSRLDHVINGELTGRAAKAAIDEMQTAVMVACVMPAIMVSMMASSSH